MFNSLFENFERFQTFLVGLLGFAGVIYTIRMNGRLVRQQYERERNQERAALRTALIAELGALRNTYEDRIHMLRKDDSGHSFLIPEYVSNHVYYQLLDRIGLLTAEELELVIDTYLLVTELPIRLKLLAKGTSDSSEQAGYIHIGKEFAADAAQIHDNFLSKIITALATIQRKLEQLDNELINP
ncbi:MAG: hypothetical protein JRF41_14350 [Deltaproteobacteria bacterium]|nr:hypothetical protein [Deltaproteobacteria bacterium]